MKTAWQLSGLAVTLVAGTAIAPAMAQQVGPVPGSIADLGTLGGGTSQAVGVSGDGTTVIGNSNNDVFRFVQGGAMGRLQGFIQAVGGSAGQVTGINSDGTVVVGWASDRFNDQHAVMWTPATGTVDLDPVNTVYGIPRAVSGDGKVVVGELLSTWAAAFRWTKAGGLERLTFPGANGTYATGVNYDGSVIVGNGDDGSRPSRNARAYRWTATAVQDLGRLNGGDDIRATGVSGDGAVVVGYANDGNMNNAQRAYYWKDSPAGGTITNMGILSGGSISAANATNRDGSVIVGNADIDGQGQVLRGFRWTQATGMITVDKWLSDGGVTLGSNVTASATGVSADGNVVVGTLQNNHAYIARGAIPAPPSTGGMTTTTTAGLMDVTNFQQSLASTPRVSGQMQNADTVINGAHSSPLFMLLDAGQSSASFTGDGGYTIMRSAQGGLGAGEFGFGRGIEGGWTVRVAGGGQYARMDTPNAGNSVFSSGYIAPDVSYAVGGGVVATLSGYFNWGKADIRRGYLNGAANDSSFGSAATQIYGVRARVDWQDALKLASTGISPFVSYTYLNAQMNGYTETGGSFPVQFNGSREVSNAVRIGADATTPLNDQFALVTRFEYGHRFEKAGAGVSGQILGLSAFSMDGASVQQDWLRGGLGVSYKLGNGDGLVMVNTSNQTGKNTTWLSASYRMKF
ncbi:putative HAF family extracellular repeat protein [Rhizobium aquaticum]|uniref:HAF family extracellular repeat protein n=1 Tax=Rhizobium aquaticum TaxID=1549636 RepID=A0ABV2J7T5_9HYPH